MKRDFWGTNNFCGYLFGAYGTQSMWGARGLKEHEDYFRAEDIGLSGHTIPANLDAYYPRPIFSEGFRHVICKMHPISV